MKKADFRTFLRDFYQYFTRGERALWCCSVALVLMAFLVFDRRDYMTLTASLVGVTSLILDAKANPMGQVLMVIPLRLLRRDAHLSGHDRAHVRVRPCLVA